MLVKKGGISRNINEKRLAEYKEKGFTPAKDAKDAKAPAKDAKKE